VRYGVDLYRACGGEYGDVIAQIADEFWRWWED
jgi:hypothetical protein